MCLWKTSLEKEGEAHKEPDPQQDPGAPKVQSADYFTAFEILCINVLGREGGK